MTPERFIDERELAEIMGVSVSTVYRLRKAGMPSRRWAKRTRRYLASEAIRWADGHQLAPCATIADTSRPDAPQERPAGTPKGDSVREQS